MFWESELQFHPLSSTEEVWRRLLIKGSSSIWILLKYLRVAVRSHSTPPLNKTSQVYPFCSALDNKTAKKKKKTKKKENQDFSKPGRSVCDTCRTVHSAFFCGCCNCMRVCEGSGIAPLVCTKQSSGPLFILKRFQCQPKLRSRGNSLQILRGDHTPTVPPFSALLYGPSNWRSAGSMTFGLCKKKIKKIYIQKQKKNTAFLKVDV